MPRCANGHESTALDYCDVCGEPLSGAVVPPANASTPAAAPAPAAPPTGSSGAATKECPECHAPNAEASAFCEDCGYDFAAAAPVAVAADPDPAPAPAAPPNPLSLDPAANLGWVAELWIDPDWYKEHGADSGEPCPSAGPPVIVRLPETGHALVGRASASRSIRPEIDCASDTAVSHRHAQLTRVNERWSVEDLRSTNGTYIATAALPLPTTPINSGTRHELSEHDRLQLGAWTRIVIRPAAVGDPV